LHITEEIGVHHADILVQTQCRHHTTCVRRTSTSPGIRIMHALHGAFRTFAVSHWELDRGR